MQRWPQTWERERYSVLSTARGSSGALQIRANVVPADSRFQAGTGGKAFWAIPFPSRSGSPARGPVDLFRVSWSIPQG